MPSFIKNNVAILVLAVVVAAAAVAVGAVAMGQAPVVTVVLVLTVYAASWGIFRLWTRSSVGWAERWPPVKIAVSALGGALAVFLAIQPIPYGRDHSGGPVTAEPQWDSPRTRELAVAACFDCHSNEVEWPWYASVAPFSWNVQRHVDAGRSKVNFSEWDRPQREADESAETVREGSMPPFYYRLTHLAARLSDAEKQDLAAGLEATFAVDPPIGGERGERDGEDD